MLANRVGAVVTKRELLTEVWRQPYGGADRTVDVHLSWLRRKLGETAAEPRYLQSVRGVGVRLVNPAGGPPLRRRITVLVALISIAFLDLLPRPARAPGQDPRRGPGNGDDRPDGPQRRDPGVGDQRALPARVAGRCGGGVVGRCRRRDLPLRSSDWGLSTTSNAAEVGRARAGEAFSVIDADGGRVYVPIALDAGTSVVVASIPVEDLYAGVPEAWWIIGATGTALLAVSLLIAAQASRRISEPLLEVAATAHRLRDGDLAARAEESGTVRDQGGGRSPQRAGGPDQRAVGRGKGGCRRTGTPPPHAGHGPEARPRRSARNRSWPAGSWKGWPHCSGPSTSS